VLAIRLDLECVNASTVVPEAAEAFPVGEDEVPQTVPREVKVAPPFEETVAPNVAEVVVIDETVGVVRVGAEATIEYVPLMLAEFSLPVPAEATVPPFAEVEEVFLYLIYNVVPAFIEMAKLVAFTSAAVVPTNADVTLDVHSEARDVDVSIPIFLGPVLLLLRFEFIAVITKLYPVGAVIE
jgi:hypothetical protein